MEYRRAAPGAAPAFRRYAMRAEIEAKATEIKQSLVLLRRHL